ncbi:hypothetical protein L208DRAFT_471341 [Tricholoma matsutake]|nr:hypothetical protein L208DRAFT_471341 [Tricholoma matsutake 945]
MQLRPAPKLAYRMNEVSQNPIPLALEILSLKTYYTAIFTLLLYDYCLTFSAEIDLAWKPRKTFASILFFLNRYSSLAFFTVVMISYALPSWTQNVYVNISMRCSSSSEYVVLEQVRTICHN